MRVHLTESMLNLLYYNNFDISDHFCPFLPIFVLKCYIIFFLFSLWCVIISLVWYRKQAEKGNFVTNYPTNDTIAYQSEVGATQNKTQIAIYFTPLNIALKNISPFRCNQHHSYYLFVSKGICEKKFLHIIINMWDGGVGCWESGEKEIAFKIPCNL